MKSIRFVALIAILILASPVLAHHSNSMFDTAKVIELTGTVKEFQWTNPHVWIQLEVAGPNGAKQEWSIEGGGPNSLSRNGWRPTTFKFGAAVTLRVNPMRDGSTGGLFVGAKFADATTLGRWE
jgi:hypothetical protein